jgi:hypothetical protein
MIGCQNCTIQLHPECLVDDVLTKTYNTLKDQVNNSAANVKATKHQVKIARKQKRQSARPYYGKFEAVIKDKEKAPCIEITDLRLVDERLGRKIFIAPSAVLSLNDSTVAQKVEP